MARANKNTGSTLLITNIILTIVIAVILWFLLVKTQQTGPSISSTGLSQAQLKDIADLQTQLALEKAKLEQMAEKKKADQLTLELAAEKLRAQKLIESQGSKDGNLALELNTQLEAEKKRIAQMITSQLRTTQENQSLIKELEQSRGQSQTLNQQIEELMEKLMEQENIASTDAATSSQTQENLSLLQAVEGDLSAFVSPEAQQQALLVAQQQLQNQNNQFEIEDGDKIPSAVYQLQAEVDNLNTALIEDSDEVDKIPSAVYQLQAAVSDIMEVDNSATNAANSLAALVGDNQESVEYLRVLEEEAEVRQNEMRLITVVRGDTLSLIAQRSYGDPLLYPKIFDANPSILVDPDKIYPGMRLRVPL